jgi:hypothetical protein
MDVYMRPWKAAINEGGLRGLMVTREWPRFAPPSRGGP